MTSNDGSLRSSLARLAMRIRQKSTSLLRVIGWCFFERLPLLAIMSKYDQFHMLAIDQIHEFSCAGTQLLLVLKRPCFTVGCKKALQDDGINCQQNFPGLGQAHQDRLMSRSMTTRLD